MGQSMKIDGKVVSVAFTSGSATYKARVHCEVESETMKAAARYAVWSLQQDARQGKLTAGETYEVEPDGTIHKTPAQLVAEMSPEQRAILLAELKAEAKRAA
jgi:hypothetical protein